MAKQLQARTLASYLPEMRETLRQPLVRMSTGIGLLDHFLRDSHEEHGGFVQPSLVVIGAEPKIGKSLLGQQIGERHVAGDKTHYTYYADMENGIVRFYKRLVGRRAQVTGAELAAGLQEEAEARMMAAEHWLERGPGRRYYYMSGRSLSQARLIDELEILGEEVPDASILVILDSLQKLPMELRERRSEVDEWLRALEEIRDRQNVVIMAISELRRPTFGAAKKYRAGATSYKESGDIEYTVDLGLAMERRDPKTKVVTLSITLNRDGNDGDVCELVPNTAYTKFTDRPITQKKEK
jgi:replicative DNA helicase